jgi:rSAM/selenodomain-associated transferase 2
VKLSVIIPTWREAEAIEGAVKSALAVGDEVIVADASSPDGTAEAAMRAGARVIVAPKGRGPQLHEGARASSGDALLFLHADARLPPRARAAIASALARPAVVGGNFRLRFVPETRAARFFSWANDERRRRLRIYYGDSAVFMRRRAYEALGGFRPIALFEDYELFRRLERLGETAYVREVEVTASARRFERSPARTFFVWSLLQGLYSIGVPPDALARLYADARAAAATVRT